MWWSSKPGRAGAASGAMLAVLALLATALTGCGFHPLYGARPNADLGVDLSSISVALIPERIGQLLAISLRDGLNPTGARVETRYVLTVAVSTGIADLAIRSDGTASRQAYSASAAFSLREVSGSRSTLLTGSARYNDSFDVGENPYTTIVNDSDAEKRAAQTISEQIRTQLAVFMRQQATRS
jgi:LPS-assembly lipoprotein